MMPEPEPLGGACEKCGTEAPVLFRREERRLCAACISDFGVRSG